MNRPLLLGDLKIKIADLWGIETFVSYEQIEWFSRLEHTYLHAKEGPSKQLLRRPQHKFAITLACQINENWKMTTSLVFTQVKELISPILTLLIAFMRVDIVLCVVKYLFFIKRMADFWPY